MCGDRLDVVLMRRRDSSLYQKQENLFLPQPDSPSVASTSQNTSSCNSSLFASDDGAENVIRQRGRWSHMTRARCCHGNDCHWHRQDLITRVQHAMLLRSKAPICLPVQDEWHQEFSVSGLLWCPRWLHNETVGLWWSAVCHVMVVTLQNPGRITTFFFWTWLSFNADLVFRHSLDSGLSSKAGQFFFLIIHSSPTLPPRKQNNKTRKNIENSLIVCRKPLNLEIHVVHYLTLTAKPNIGGNHFEVQYTVYFIYIYNFF